MATIGGAGGDLFSDSTWSDFALIPGSGRVKLIAVSEDSCEACLTLYRMDSDGLTARKRLADARKGGTEHPWIIWIIDSEQWPRACLRAELIERGYDAVGFNDIKRALPALRNRRRNRPDVIVLELRGQEVTRKGLGALIAVGAPLILLGGAQEVNDPLIKEFRFAAILKRPITLGKIADVIDDIVGSARRLPDSMPGNSS